MNTLFESQAPRPLADRLRPESLAHVVGQDHLMAADGPIGRMAASNRVTSNILWGPPGTGKTTIARLLAQVSDLHFEPMSAVFSGVADLRRVFEEAEKRRDMGRGTLLFIDEIHRFNRAQQDGFLPYVENGTVILIGATTENPSFALNAALLSRCQVLVLNRLDDGALDDLLKRAEELEGKPLPLTRDARGALRAIADGDGRYIFNLAEEVYALPSAQLGKSGVLDGAALLGVVQQRAPLYDKSSDGHFNLISALHKSLRGSDADAALYWLARMLSGGEDPKYIARRLVRMASEDIGLADPQALTMALAAWETYERLGSPEGELALASCVLYLATAPKSNAAYRAYKSAMGMARQTGSLMPPKHILNAPTSMMKDLGYGKGYQYDHDAADGFSGQDYFPEEIGRATLYHPGQRGFEKDLRKRLEYWARLRDQRGGGPDSGQDCGQDSGQDSGQDFGEKENK